MGDVSLSLSDEEEESSDEDEEEEDENDNLCVICRKDGMLICCDQCPLSYHLACARPPLKKVPRGKWVCQVCTGAETKAAKVKLIKGKIRMHNALKYISYQLSEQSC